MLPRQENLTKKKLKKKKTTTIISYFSKKINSYFSKNFGISSHASINTFENVLF